MSQSTTDWQKTKDWLAEKPKTNNSDVMYVDVDGYEGPLDLLLELARRQKVDLANISVLALAEQYLDFIETIRKKRIDIAADYLVVAAWLAYLKSRLMVPQIENDEEPSGEMMAAMLQFRLKRLEAMRNAGEQLINRNRLGRQIFARGNPQAIKIKNSSVWQASLYDLLKSYSLQRQRGIVVDYEVKQRKVMSLKQAHKILQQLIGENVEWVAIDEYLADYLGNIDERASILASSFASSLELVRQGSVELRQSVAFGKLLIRYKKSES